MIAFLLPLFARIGVPARLQRAVAWLLIVALAVIAIVAGVMLLRHIVRSHNETIATTAVDAHDKDLSLEAYNLVMAAGEKADANQAARDEIDTTNEKELTNAASTGDTGAVGPGTAAVLSRMRDQQAAGRR